MSAGRRPDRRAVARALVAAAREHDALVVTGLGGPAWDVSAAGDRAEHFYLWGGMGGAVAVGLGLALARARRRVLVVTGDGELLMGLGSLATVALQAPANLAIAVLDNERYGETGMQATHTAGPTDLAAVALGAGLRDAWTVAVGREVAEAAERLATGRGPLLAAFKVRRARHRPVLPERQGPWLKERFRRALGIAPE